MVSSYQFGACIWIIRESTVKNRGLQAIFDSSQDGLVSLEAPWYLPSFCDFLDGEDIVATKGVGPLKGCGVVFSDLFFWGVETTKSSYTLENALKCEHGSWTWIHGRWFPSGNHAHDVMVRCWISWVVTNSMKKCQFWPIWRSCWTHLGLRSYSMHCNSCSPGCMRRWENFWEMGRQQIMAGEWDSERLFVTSSWDGYDEFLFFLFQAI